jgi:formiminoglutamase
MQIAEFLRPVSIDESFSRNTVGGKICAWDRKQVPDNSLWIVGLSDLHGNTFDADLVREKLYHMIAPIGTTNIVDLGDIISLSAKDQRNVLDELFKLAETRNSIVVFISCNNVGKLPFALQEVSGKNSLALIDRAFDYSFNSVDKFGFLDLKKFNEFYLVGNQSYYTENFEEHTNFFEYRLGRLRDDMTEIEPVFRAVNKVIFNLRAVRYSDFPDASEPTPNGMYAEEICRLAWYAGNSDTVNGVLLTGFAFHDNRQSLGAILTAELLYHFIEGVSTRKNEDPAKNRSNFKEYYVESNKLPDDLVFYKSKLSGKYWMKYGDKGKIIPCTKADMDMVLNNHVPDRLWRNMNN